MGAAPAIPAHLPQVQPKPKCLRVVLPAPRGFCAGVDMAIESLNRALERFGAPLYAYHEIVHNKHVVADFEARGVRFVDDVGEIPEGRVVVFSAHGVSPAVSAEAARRDLLVIDATCPLVTKVHSEARRFAEEGFTVVLIGHRGHDESVGVMGEAIDQIQLVETFDDIDALDVRDAGKVAVLTQTTLSVIDTVGLMAELRARFPALVSPPRQDICYATENRQAAVRHSAPHADLVLVVGSQNSSNSNRLVEEGIRCARPAYLIDGPEDIDERWFVGVTTVVLTAGASVPETLVQSVVDWIGGRYSATVEEHWTAREDVAFRLPVLVR